MKTKSGQLILNKSEVKMIENLLQHCERDIDYRSDGSFVKMNGKFDEKEAKKVSEAIGMVRWIITEANMK